jgi:GTP-binding protein
VEIKTATFVKSSANLAECPKDDIPAFAFIGRSNVGKSSLINMLTGNGKLAKTSSTPGKTQLINHFLINEKWYLVDLPGYGYAKVSKKDRAKFQLMINTFIKKSPNLLGTFVLIDIRIPPQKNDLEFMEWLGTNGIPFCMVFTKLDKISSSQYNKNLLVYKKEMEKVWEEFPTFFSSSSKNEAGKTDILNFIGKVLETES